MSFGLKSGDIAKKRLKNVVETQRAGMTQKDSKMILSDMEKLLASYFELSDGAFRIERKKLKSGGVAKRLVYTARINSIKRHGKQV